MKAAYYLLCVIPSICLLISWATPNDFNAGGPSVGLQLGLLAAIFFLSPAFTILGINGIVAAKTNKESVIWPSIATAAAAFPGLYFLIGHMVAVSN